MALYSYGPAWLWPRIVTAYIVMACIVMDSDGLCSCGHVHLRPYIVMAYIAMAYVVMDGHSPAYSWLHIVMAQCSYGPYSYGPYSYGLHNYGLFSYGIFSYGLQDIRHVN